MWWRHRLRDSRLCYSLQWYRPVYPPNMAEPIDRASGVELTTCLGCGSFVSSRFNRIFGDNEDRVHGCLECMTSKELFNGGTVVDYRG
jgi:hypothetical protein